MVTAVILNHVSMTCLAQAAHFPDVCVLHEARLLLQGLHQQGPKQQGHLQRLPDGLLHDALARALLCCLHLVCFAAPKPSWGLGTHPRTAQVRLLKQERPAKGGQYVNTDSNSRCYSTSTT